MWRSIEQQWGQRSTAPLLDAHEGIVTEKDEVGLWRLAREGQVAEEQRQPEQKERR